MSAFLVIMTLLTLLPTSALAASGSGTGIKATTDPNLWSTRLTSTGQQYSYRPPTAAGKQLYCMDLGYSYRYGTASFLNSYTYQSATGVDSDALWDAAVAGTGLGEMDAITKENVPQATKNSMGKTIVDLIVRPMRTNAEPAPNTSVDSP